MYETAQRTGSGFGSSVSQEDRPTPPIPSAQHGLDEGTNRLHAIIGELEQRLQPVLGPSKPQGVGNDAKGSPTLQSVASRLRESSAAVSAACGRIEDILGRLEL